MRPAFLFTLGVTLSVSTSALAQNPAASRLVVKPAEELQWTDLNPNFPGVKVVTLWGDFASGSYGVLLRLPAGFAAPLHTHSYDMKVVILSGTYIQAPEGKPEFRLGPGSYFLQPGADYRHTTTCGQGSDCVLLVESEGPFDLKMVDGAAAP